MELKFLRSLGVWSQKMVFGNRPENGAETELENELENGPKNSLKDNDKNGFENVSAFQLDVAYKFRSPVITE